MKTYSFEKLEVWQDSRKPVKDVYMLTKLFPDDERFGLTSQVRRAMISVSCNISEGTSRWSNKEKIRFIEIAFSSLMEVLNCLILSTDLEYIEQSKLLQLRESIDKVANKLNSLSAHFRKKDSEKCSYVYSELRSVCLYVYKEYLN